MFSSQLWNCHITPILHSLHWLRITERIEYKLLSLTYKVLTTTQLPYLHNLISVQRPRSTRSSSVVTLARPPTSSSLKITYRFFRYDSPCLWNQLFINALFLRQPHSGTSSSISDSHIPSSITSSSFDSPLCSSTHSFFTPGLKPVSQILPPIVSLLPPDCFHRLLPGPFLLSYSWFLFLVFLVFISVPCARLSWPSHHCIVLYCRMCDREDIEPVKKLFPKVLF